MAVAISQPCLSERFLCLFLGAENGVLRGAADGARPLEGGLPILHGNALGVLHFSLLLALDAVIQISHCCCLLTCTKYAKRDTYSLGLGKPHAKDKPLIPEPANAAAPSEPRSCARMARKALARCRRGVPVARLPVTWPLWPARPLDSVPERRVPARCAGRQHAGSAPPAGPRQQPGCASRRYSR